MRVSSSSLTIPVVALQPRVGHQHDTASHDQHEPENKWTQVGSGLLLGGAIIALGNQESVLNFARKKVGKGANVPSWLRPKIESSALFQPTPLAVLKALGLMSAVSMINKGIGLSLASPLLALELGAAFHAMIPGSIGMKTAHFLTMAPLLAGSALVASTAHEKIEDRIDDQKGWSANQKAFAKGLSGLAVSGVTAVGAMALFPRVHLGLMELKNPFAHATTERSLWGGEKGWYINTVHHVDGVVNGVRESLKTAWQTKRLNQVGRVFKNAFEDPFLVQGDPKLAGKDNYYRRHEPSMNNRKGVEHELYNILRAIPAITATSRAYTEGTVFSDALGTYTSKGLSRVFQPYLKSELAHMTTQNLGEKISTLEALLAQKEQRSFLKIHQEVEARLAKEAIPDLIRPSLVAREVLEQEALKKLDAQHPVQVAYKAVAFHGRADQAHAYEERLLQAKAQKAYEAERQAKIEEQEDLEAEWDDLHAKLSHVQNDRTFLSKVKNLNDFLMRDQNATFLQDHQNILEEYANHLNQLEQEKKPLPNEEEPLKLIAKRILSDLAEKKSTPVQQVPNALGGNSLFLEYLSSGSTEELEKLYGDIATHNASPVELAEMRTQFHIHDENCSHSKGVSDTPSHSKSDLHDHAHCEDDHHHHAPEAPKKGTPTFDPHDANGGDMFHWVFSGDAIKKLFEKQPDLIHGLEHEGIGGLASLKAIAQHLHEAPEVLKPQSTLADNFNHVTRALAVLKPLHQDGHIAPDTQANIKAVLDKNKWSPEARDAFIQELQLYTSKADHINGHNPQVVKAWAIMAGAGGAVCANGCCAGSIFCFNEAMALAGSLYSSVVQALHQPPANTPSSDEKPPLLKPASAIAPFYRNVKTQKALAQKKASP
jgi:hypothetical protein